MSLYERSELLLGPDYGPRLRGAAVAVFGLGGVGSWCCEALARAGVGRLLLVDGDVVSDSNRNRQLPALCSTVGRPKTEVMAARIRDINPDCAVDARQTVFSAANADLFPLAEMDYVVDAIDTVSAKLELVCRCAAAGTPIISCLGAGNKLDPTRFRVCDLYETDTDPLARVLRKELRKRGVERLTVVWSPEPPRAPCVTIAENGRRQLPGSVSFVPPAAGLAAAGKVVRDLLGLEA
jgi:tRNA A37 threonylcarbamoyladenosine dehydratase